MKFTIWKYAKMHISPAFAALVLLFFAKTPYILIFFGLLPYILFCLFPLVIFAQFFTPTFDNLLHIKRVKCLHPALNYAILYSRQKHLFFTGGQFFN